MGFRALGTEFGKLVYTPAGLLDATLAICASRAGGVGILNAELTTDVAAILAALEGLAAHAGAPFGLKLDAYVEPVGSVLHSYAARGLRWLIVDGDALDGYRALLPDLRHAGVRVLAELTTPDWPAAMPLAELDGLVIKGNEAGGLVGEDSTYILLQKWLRRKPDLPMYLRGGMTPQVAAGCAAMGMAGGVLDSQLLLMEEAALPADLRKLIGNLAGSETIAVGNPEVGEYFRLLIRPSLTAAKQFAAAADGLSGQELRSRVRDRATWSDPIRGLLPIGQDVTFAARWRQQFGSVAAVLGAIDTAIATYPGLAQRHRSIAADAPLARALGIRLPIIQGPMTRVSDTAPFAGAVAGSGALPMVALAVMKGAALERLLEDCTSLLGDRPWGIGLLGFAPQELLDEQLSIVARFKPTYAIIAGGRPDQAVQLERSGIPSFLHVPAANLIPLFLQDGARRFIFEGRECGGHIGPLSSFVLWSSMIDRLLIELPLCKVAGEELEVIFAGGIHDALSCAIVQIMAAPLAAAGVRIGILMGSAYLFTREIVTSGAIVEQFQKEVLECEHTVSLESGVGHASRCAYSPFARDFFQRRAVLRQDGVPAEDARHQLDELILGRLRIASKGLKREGANGDLHALTAGQQHLEGMYMLGQVATLRDAVTDVDALHEEVTAGALALIDRSVAASGITAPTTRAAAADIAVIGMACALPKATSPGQFWDNIISGVDAITEIPPHRWDWRLYFDSDRNAPDKVYSKWGGFLDDMPFDPLSYGMPPKSIDAVDPMQLMGLEIARRTLMDAGYHNRPFDRERAAVILGVSGGIGDVGMQYGLRSELPRFTGGLPDAVAQRLPDWTEDSFAGILPNVAAGRIANRLNFGGMNFTTDAACASSLAALYQAVTELTSGRSDFVITGGLDTVQGPFGYLCFSKTQALSPRGKCSTFDASGDGIVISEGIAMVALKRLADAERDGDRIYCVIKGVGSSSDGSAKGLTAPLPAGQLRAMRRAYDMAGFEPASVGLFEAHGTGTVAGDTAELESTTRLIQESSKQGRQAVIGSVKTMIGHTKATAGAAGLLKAVLALHHRVLPPHNNVSKPIDALADASSPLYLLGEAAPWLKTVEHPRRAACSAFGFGGTNFHVVLEEYSGEYRPWLRASAADAWSAELLLWSGSDHPALVAKVEAFAAAIDRFDGVWLRDLAASLARGFQAKTHTLAIVARNMGDLRTKLGVALARLRNETRNLPPGIHVGQPPDEPRKLAVLFSGQGSQYPNMAREAALHFDPVSEALAGADAILQSEFAARFGPGFPLSRFILPRGAYDEQAEAEARKRLASTDVAQPALGAVEAGLLHLLRSFGLRADMFAGHSYGEFVALYAAGVIGFETLMRLSAARGRFIIDAARDSGAELGTMAAVNGARQLVEQQIGGIAGVLVANHNAPSQSVISGTRLAVQAAVARLRERGVEVTEIPVAAAFHSELVRPAQQALGALIAATEWSAASIPVYSNTTGRPHSSNIDEVRRQMTEHLVRPVEFVAEVEAMYQDGARIFLEIGPRSVLTRLVGRILGERSHVAIAIDDGTGIGGLLAGLGQMLCAGVDLDINRLFASRDCRVGDPGRPDSLHRRELPSKHAWLINGSAARRADMPPTQVGVTLEQAALAAQSAPESAATASPPAVASEAHALSPRTEQIGTSRAVMKPPARVPNEIGRSSRPPGRLKFVRTKDHAMDDRRTSDSEVIAEYFATMRQFLESQERVMEAFLAGSGAAQSPVRSRTLAINGTRSAELAAAPIIAPTAKQYVPIPTAAAPPLPKLAEPAIAPVSAASTARTAVATAPAAAEPKTNGATSLGNGVAARSNGNGNGNGAGHEPATGALELSRDKLVEALLGIVEEKTGYPRDMLGLDQNLEADLGIDSIKRVEVVGAFLKLLPEAVRTALANSGAKLSSKSTLNGMLELLAHPPNGTGGSATRPFDSAGMGAEAGDVSHPSRLIMRTEREPLTPAMGRKLATGLFIVTRDTLGIATALAGSLRSRGGDVVLLDRSDLESEQRLVALCQPLRARTIGGIVHLAALGGLVESATDGAAQWRAALQLNEKALFLLVRELHASLAQQANVIAASGLGGLFGRDASSRGELQLQGGAPGMLKSLLQERSDLRVKAVDLDPTLAVATLAAELMDEIELDGGRQEVGYPSHERTIFRTVAAETPVDPARDTNLQNLVVLATGGLRGITAETLRELAKPGNTLILTGRSALPEAESPETARFTDPDSLRKHFIAQVRSGAIKSTPGDIQRRVQSILASREMLANLADFRATGADAHYYRVDVTSEEALARLIREIERRYQRIDGVVHGAGVIEDKLLVDKTSDSWSRVVETKVFGLLLLQKLLKPDNLKFFTVFSSVAGRYGNSGQADYATANELMNRICVALQARWGGRVAVSALCWGPWGPTKFGSGMVTAETEAKFKERGVSLVSAALGRRLFRQELVRRAGTAVEIICGEGPWESEEVKRGTIRPPSDVPRPIKVTPWLGNPLVATGSTGKKTVSLRVNAGMYGDSSLDSGAAAELLAEAARLIWPQWRVVELREFRVLKSLELADAENLHIQLSPSTYGSSAGFEVSASLQSDSRPGLETHFQCVLGLHLALPSAPPHDGVASAEAAAERSSPLPKLFVEWLAREGRPHTIERIDDFSTGGASASVRSSQTVSWLPCETSPDKRWLFDPALLEAAAHMVSLWTLNYLSESVTPKRYGKVTRYRELMPARLRMEFKRTDSPDPEFVRGDVVFLDEHGHMMLSLEELDCVLSPPTDGNVLQAGAGAESALT